MVKYLRIREFRNYFIFLSCFQLIQFETRSLGPCEQIKVPTGGRKKGRLNLRDMEVEL